MTRQIKFRAWDKVNKEWCTDVDGITMDGKPYFGGTLYDPESIIITQCTGMHDKNGKEIWEGDIVKGKYARPSIFEIEYELLTNCGDCTNDSGPGFNFKLQDSEWLEVLGNIFENPEFLEGK